MVGMDSRRRSGDSGRPPSVVGKLGLSLFFLFFFAMGSLFEVFLVREFGRAMGQRAWKKTPCTIVSSEVQERAGDKTPYLSPSSYQYEYAGRSYTGSAYKRNYSGSDKYSETQTLVQKYPPGSDSFCYVNPRQSRRGGPPAGQPGYRSGALVSADLRAHRRRRDLLHLAQAATRGGETDCRNSRPPQAARAWASTDWRRCLPSSPSWAASCSTRWASSRLPGPSPPNRGSTTPCQVLRAEVRSHDSDDGTTYSVYILYQYEFNGQTYKSDRYEFVGGSSSGYQGKARVVEQYQAAANPVCYVNPNNPSEAVLKRGFHAKLLLALFPLPFLLVGVGGLVATWRGKIVTDKQTVETAGLAQQPARASGGLATSAGGRQRPGRSSSRSSRRRPSSSA